jgi:hypothetical protein
MRNVDRPRAAYVGEPPERAELAVTLLGPWLVEDAAKHATRTELSTGAIGRLARDPARGQP